MINVSALTSCDRSSTCNDVSWKIHSVSTTVFKLLKLSVVIGDVPGKKLLMINDAPTLTSIGVENTVMNGNCGALIEPPTRVSTGAENEVTFWPRSMSAVTLISAGNATIPTVLFAFSEPIKICITGGANV